MKYIVRVLGKSGELWPRCGDLNHHRGEVTHIHCGNQLCCWGPQGKREKCPRPEARR